MCSPRVASPSHSISSAASTISAATDAPTAPDACVIIGRGRKINEHPGNVRFHSIVQSHLDIYSQASNKSKKTAIILAILAEVHSQAGADFCKLDSATNTYVMVEETAARICIAQKLRDHLNATYKSSKQHKQRRRAAIKKECVRQAKILYPASYQTSSSNSMNNFVKVNSSNDLVTANTMATFMPSSMATFMPSSRLGVQQFPEQQQVSSFWDQPYPSMVPPSTASCYLNDIIQEAFDLTESADFLQQQQQQQVVSDQELFPVLSMTSPPAAAEADVFASLFQAFAPTDMEPSSMVDETLLFEPTPILEEQVQPDIWEPLPLSG